MAVDADLPDLAGGERLLEPVGLSRDLGLQRAGLDRVHDAAHALHGRDLGEDLLLHLIGERLHEVRAAERIGGVGRPRLLGADLHRTERDELRLRRRDRVRLVVGRQSHRLRAGQRGGESDVGAPDDVVLGLLEDERRPAASDQRPEHPRPRIRRAEPLTEHARVQAPTRAKLCDLLEDLPPRGEIERDPRREVVDGDPARAHALDVRGRDQKPVRHLLRGRAARLADVVPAHRDRVRARITLRRELDEVRHESQGRLDRVDPRAPRDELLEDVVLGRRDDAVGRRALLLGDHVVHGRDRRRHAVDRERDADAVERDAGERVLHIGERVDRHPDPAHLTLGAGVVGVEA